MGWDTTKPIRRIRATASGRFVLRISPGLHAALRRAATEAGLSLNDYCARKLAAPLGNLAALRGGPETVERAARLFGDRLVGVAAFGSWARGEPVKGSDVDVLVVLDRRVTLARELYRTWDEAPVSWGDRAVEPHFVHLPEPEEGVAGIWAEVALDGLVLFEQGLRLSTRLVQVRREIAAGRIVRRVAHGQPYWTGVA
jgi:predicted nucleotidyltransferase